MACSGYVLTLRGFLMNKKLTIGIFGGTFDPIHLGHLRAALEVHEHFKLTETLFIPCKNPPHRSIPLASPADRLQLVCLATEHTNFKVDEREMNREGPSYSVDTLMSLRQEHPKASLCLILGEKAFLGLTSWHQWEKILSLANIIVTCRTGWVAPLNGPLADLINQHRLNPHESLTDFDSGFIQQYSITSLDISASYIRSLILAGHSPQFLLPEKVYDYIQQNGLYKPQEVVQS